MTNKDIQVLDKRIAELEERELELMRQVITLQSEIIALKNQQKEWLDDKHGILLRDLDGTLLHFAVEPEIEVELDEDTEWQLEYQE
jgi:hypothetical protein